MKGRCRVRFVMSVQQGSVFVSQHEFCNKNALVIVEKVAKFMLQPNDFCFVGQSLLIEALFKWYTVV